MYSSKYIFPTYGYFQGLNSVELATITLDLSKYTPTGDLEEGSITVLYNGFPDQQSFDRNNALLISKIENSFEGFILQFDSKAEKIFALDFLISYLDKQIASYGIAGELVIHSGFNVDPEALDFLKISKLASVDTSIQAFQGFLKGALDTLKHIRGFILGKRGSVLHLAQGDFPKPFPSKHINKPSHAEPFISLQSFLSFSNFISFLNERFYWRNAGTLMSSSKDSEDEKMKKVYDFLRTVKSDTLIDQDIADYLIQFADKTYYPNPGVGVIDYESKESTFKKDLRHALNELISDSLEGIKEFFTKPDLTEEVANFYIKRRLSEIDALIRKVRDTPLLNLFEIAKNALQSLRSYITEQYQIPPTDSGSAVGDSKDKGTVAGITKEKQVQEIKTFKWLKKDVTVKTFAKLCLEKGIFISDADSRKQIEKSIVQAFSNILLNDFSGPRIEFLQSRGDSPGHLAFITIILDLMNKNYIQDESDEKTVKILNKCFFDRYGGIIKNPPPAFGSARKNNFVLKYDETKKKYNSLLAALDTTLPKKQ